MNKLLFVALLGFAGLMFAQEKDDVKVAGTWNEVERRYVYTWTSTCNHSHTYSFPGTWSSQDIAVWISNFNVKECGVRPRNVFVEIPPDHY